MQPDSPSVGPADTRLRWGFYIALGALGAAALAFHHAQQQPGAPGGPVALPKALWLAAVIALWYVVPALAALERRAARAVRLAFAALLLDTALRAAVELWMMYSAGGWEHRYGIAHDAFSAALCVALARALGPRTGLDRLLRGYLWLAAASFVLEAGFAVYLHARMGGDDAIWFVPAAPEHGTVLALTWLALALLGLYLVFLARRWLHDAPGR